MIPFGIRCPHCKDWHKDIYDYALHIVAQHPDDKRYKWAIGITTDPYLQNMYSGYKVKECQTVR